MPSHHGHAHPRPLGLHLHLPDPADLHRPDEPQPDQASAQAKHPGRVLPRLPRHGHQHVGFETKKQILKAVLHLNLSCIIFTQRHPDKKTVRAPSIP